jgi:pilus assembly protein CpaB
MAMRNRSVWAACTCLVVVTSVAAQTPADEKVTVLVAKKQIPQWWYIKKAEDFFEIQQVPRSAAPKGAFSAFDDKDIRDGFRVARIFTQGSPLTRDDLITPDMEGGRRYPTHPRALAIKVSPESLVGGFIVLGSKVDVLWTFRTTTGEPGCLTILQDMRVLAVDALRDPREKIQANTVTLEVKPEEAEKLALATGSGEFRLVLRRPGDENKQRVQPTKPEDVFKHVPGPGADQKTPAVPPAPPPRQVPIPLSLDTMARGFIVPGSRVDVIVTFRGTGEAGSHTILQDILVTAVDKPQRTEEFVGQRVTVSLQPEEADKLALASCNFEFRLVARAPGDDKKVQLNGLGQDDLFKQAGERPPEDKAPVNPPGPPKKEKVGLAPVIPPGYRAIAIKVTPEGLVGGFVLPGARVDVLCTVKRDKQSVSQKLLENILVLAVDTQEVRNGDGPPIVFQTATLAATPDDCQKLALAANLGELRLALRPPADARRKGDGRDAVLPPGHRAIAIKTNAYAVVLPGKRVDVVCITKAEKEPVTKTILENVLVLAVDARFENDARSPMPVQTVTLAVTPENAQKLASAASVGELRLHPRPWEEKKLRLKPTEPEDLPRPKPAQPEEK